MNKKDGGNWKGGLEAEQLGCGEFLSPAEGPVHVWPCKRGWGTWNGETEDPEASHKLAVRWSWPSGMLWSPFLKMHALKMCWSQPSPESSHSHPKEKLWGWEPVRCLVVYVGTASTAGGVGGFCASWSWFLPGDYLAPLLCCTQWTPCYWSRLLIWEAEVSRWASWLKATSENQYKASVWRPSA